MLTRGGGGVSQMLTIADDDVFKAPQNLVHPINPTQRGGMVMILWKMKSNVGSCCQPGCPHCSLACNWDLDHFSSASKHSSEAFVFFSSSCCQGWQRKMGCTKIGKIVGSAMKSIKNWVRVTSDPKVEGQGPDDVPLVAAMRKI